MNNKSLALTMLCGLIFCSLFFFPSALDRTMVPRFLGLTSCLIIFTIFLIKTKKSISLSLDLISISYIFFVLFCALGFFWSNTKSEALFVTSKEALSILTFIFSCYIFKHHKEYFLERFLKFSVVLFFISFCFTLWQVFEISVLNKDTLYHISGINGHKNLYSSFLFLNFFFLLMAYFRLTNPWKIIALLALILSVFLIALLKTKAVWIGSFITLLLYFFFYILRHPIKKLNIKTTSLIILIVIFTNLIFMFGLRPFIQQTINPTELNITTSLLKKETFKLEEERLVLWDKTYSLLEDHLLRGVGPGNWQIHLPNSTLNNLWRGDELNYTFQRPHNDFLWILSETGIVGFNLFILFVTSTIVYLIKSLKSTDLKNHFYFEVIASVSFIIGYYIISFFDFPRERMEHNAWISLIFGLSYNNILLSKSFEGEKNVKVEKFVLYFILGVLVFIFITGINRLKGEYYTKKMFDAKNQNDNFKIIQFGKSAQNYAYSIDPTSVPIAWHIGNANAALGNFVAAKTEFMNAYALSPFNRNVLNDLGSSCVYNNDKLLGIKFFEEAARISPRFDDPKLNLVALYINDNNFAKAKFWLNELLHDSERRSQYQKIIDLSENK